MILTFLLTIAANFFFGIASLTQGVATLPPAITSAFGYAFSASNQLNYILPMDAFYGALALVISVEIAIWTFQGAVWIYRHIPFIGH